MDHMKHKLLLISLFFYTPLCESSSCTRYTHQLCIEDCKWNKENNKCESCPVGYQGNNCSVPCRYPNFGKDCQEDCSHCDEKWCNPTYGCITTVTTNRITKGTTSSSFSLDPVIIGTLTSSGFLLVFISFAIVTVFNRRRFVRNIRRRAHFIDSIIMDFPDDSTQRNLTNDSLLRYSRS
ncbi:uncharacterized protein LOC133186019 [Saccostrea echinata]|uniref:uncharacterized protein LOC133186019 n=1 Tax=Saccostrea echinata TaxID=191078 RepID=UPI002A7F6598|nr:uncharacterized protein LOC133186019 [Saccostrea echinata]